MEHKRADRVSDLIRQEVAELLLRRVKDPRIESVTITGVEVTADLQHAKIFYTVLGTPSEEDKKNTARGLDKARGFIRQELESDCICVSSPRSPFTTMVRSNTGIE